MVMDVLLSGQAGEDTAEHRTDKSRGVRGDESDGEGGIGCVDRNPRTLGDEAVRFAAQCLGHETTRVRHVLEHSARGDNQFGPAQILAFDAVPLTPRTLPDYEVGR
jgi:hypothetical protein